jgi:hypothetical protein
MKYSARNVSNVSDTDIQLEESLSYGKLYINNLNRRVYVGGGTIAPSVCGDSNRYLEEFSDFSLQDNYDGALVTIIKDIYGDLVLGSKLPVLKLELLGNFVEPSTRIGTYLGFTSNKVTGLTEYRPTVGELADVNLDSIGPSYNNYVLTWNARSFIVKLNKTLTIVPKDILGKGAYGFWSLAPEASSIISFDDGYGQNATPRQIFRIPTTPEQSRYKYINSNLTIAWDKSPTLSGELKGNSSSVYDVKASTVEKVLTSIISTVSINPLNTSCVILSPSNVVKLIEISIDGSNLIDGMLSHCAVILKQYKGSLKFTNNRISFENSILPSIKGGDTLLSISIIREGDIRITITQKAMTMKN